GGEAGPFMELVRCEVTRNLEVALGLIEPRLTRHDSARRSAGLSRTDQLKRSPLLPAMTQPRRYGLALRVLGALDQPARFERRDQHLNIGQLEPRDMGELVELEGIVVRIERTPRHAVEHLEDRVS